MIKTLYLDDSKAALMVAKHALQDLCEMDCVYDIPEALEAIRQTRYEVILLDYSLFGGTGFDFAAKVRQVEGYEMTPLILISASHDNEMAYRAMKAGINDSFSKPIPVAELRLAIQAQVANPHVKKVERGDMEVWCLAWAEGDLFKEYSPDLGGVVKGKSAQEAHERMALLLAEHVEKEGKDGLLLEPPEVVCHRLSGKGPGEG